MKQTPVPPAENEEVCKLIDKADQAKEIEEMLGNLPESKQKVMLEKIYLHMKKVRDNTPTNKFKSEFNLF